MLQLDQYLHNLTPASKGFLTCTQTNTAWHGFYSSHKKAAFLEDVNLPPISFNLFGF